MRAGDRVVAESGCESASIFGFELPFFSFKSYRYWNDEMGWHEEDEFLPLFYLLRCWSDLLEHIECRAGFWLDRLNDVVERVRSGQRVAWWSGSR